MNFFSFIPAIAAIIDKVLPDQKAADEAKIKLAELAAKGSLAELEVLKEVARAQADVNTAEAAGTIYQSSWRPTIGYVCAAALAYNYIFYPLLTWFTFMYHPDIKVPESPVDEHMWELIMGMLGLGFVRSWEKRKHK